MANLKTRISADQFNEYINEYLLWGWDEQTAINAVEADFYTPLNEFTNDY